MATRTKAAISSVSVSRPDDRKSTARPQYYRLKDGRQVIDVINDITIAFILIKGPLEIDKVIQVFCLGNAVKYHMRSGRKEGAINDIEKRDEYLGMGKIDAKFWKDIAIPVMEKALGKSK